MADSDNGNGNANDNVPTAGSAVDGDGRPARPLSPAARRALAEADERRREAGASQAVPQEVDGRDGPEPTRFGDWERNGIVSDF